MKKPPTLTPRRRRHAAELLASLMLREADPRDQLSDPDRNLLVAFGFVEVRGSRGLERAWITPRGLGVGLAQLAQWFPARLHELGRVMSATAGCLEAGREAPELRVEHPAPAGAEAPASAGGAVVALAARAALGLEPGLQVSVRPATSTEAATYEGLAGRLRVRLDFVARSAVHPDVEARVPDDSFWVGADEWRQALRAAEAAARPRVKSTAELFGIDVEGIRSARDGEMSKRVRG